MDVLLTGASGFLGRNFILNAPADWRILAVYNSDPGFAPFVEALQRPGLAAARCDLTDTQAVAALFETHGREWDRCLYLAAKVDIPWSVREPKNDLLVNVTSLLNVLESVQAGKLVYFSSGAVYDGLTGEIPPESPCAPTLPYAISKLTAERYVRFFGERRKSVGEYLIVRFFGAYGPYEAPHKIYTQLIRRFVLEGQSHYKLYGDGQNLIDAMYVSDAVDAVIAMLSGDHWNDTVNLAGGRPRTIESLAQETAGILGVRDVIIEKQGVAHEHNHFWGSTAEMRRFYGFQPRVDLSEGMIRFSEFLKANAHSRSGG